MVRAVNQSDLPAPLPGFTYTPDRATKTLPLVRRVVKDLMRLQSSIDQQKTQLQGVGDLSETIHHQAYQEELADMRETLLADEKRLSGCVSELGAMGLILHHPFDGTIDFPAMLNRRPIRLCWRPSDESVEYWHEMEETSQDRKKIDHKMLPALAS